MFINLRFDKRLNFKFFMKDLLKFNPLIVFISFILLFSCGDDAPAPTPKSSEKIITAFKFSTVTPEAIGFITHPDGRIQITVPEGTDITKLIPTITVSEKATVSPASGVAQDFTGGPTYTVTAEDGSSKAYRIEVTVPISLSIGKSITSFKFSSISPEVIGTINEDEKKITLTVPYGTKVKALVPAIEISKKATISPASGVATDFTNPVTYTVTASNGVTQEYIVKVIISSTVPEGALVISEITDTSISRGETMVIKGIHLSKAGTATNINFIPWPNGGVTLIRTGVANTDGTQVTYTIPNDFPTGTYSVAVEVDLEFSEEYGEIIKINP
jgi:hypothetical protein